MGQNKSSIISKIALSFGLIFTSTIYAAWQQISGEEHAGPAPTTATITPGQSYKDANGRLLETLANLERIAAEESARTTTTTPTPTKPQTKPPSTTPPPTPTPIPTRPAGKYVDGSYTGDATDAYYGTVQVRVVIRNGLIADVQFLQHPDSRSTSQYINGQAMPLLTQEAVQSQNAQVDGVSGATFTSEAFRQSLASALTKAV